MHSFLDGLKRELYCLEYCNLRYASQESHEWYRTFVDLWPFLEKHLPPPSSTAPNVLHLGTGMSTLPSNLHQLGYPTQTAINFSSVCISTMSALHAFLELPITCFTMGVCTMTSPADWVDIAIEKGALDAMHNGSLLDLANEVKADLKTDLDQVVRVLNPGGGKWLYVTWQQSGLVAELLERSGVWNVDVEALAEQGDLQYHDFVITKSK